jgi:hypothetical protein
MTYKISLAALAVSAALITIPTGANAGFLGHDRNWSWGYWGGVDARMSRLWSFGWLCRDQAVAEAKPAKVRRYKAAPTK